MQSACTRNRSVVGTYRPRITLGLLVGVAIILVGLGPTAGPVAAQDAPETAAAAAVEAELAAIREKIAALDAEMDALKRRLADLESRLAAPAPPPSSAEPPRDSRVVWMIDLKSDSKGSGHVADITGDGKPEIVFGTYFGDEQVYAVRASTGEIVWKNKSDGGPFDASVAIADLNGDGQPQILIADSASGKLFCFGNDGREQWTIRLPSGTDSPPAVADLDGDGLPEIIVGAMWSRGGVGSVVAIDPRTQQFLWQTPIRGCVQSEPGIADLNGDGVLDVVVTSWRGDRGIHALNGKDGTPLWTFTTAGNAQSMGMYHGVTIVGPRDNPRILMSTCDGDIYCLSATGDPIWHQRRDDYLFAAALAADFTGDGEIEFLIGGRRLYLLSAADGREIWSRQLGGSIDRGGAVVDWGNDGQLDVVIAAQSRLFVLNGRTGATLFEFDAARDENDPYEKIASAPLVADFTGDGHLDCFVVCGRGYSGEWKARNFGRAMLIRLGPGSGEWPTFRGNLHRTGHLPRPR